MSTARAWDGLTPSDDETDVDILQQAASYTLAENDLDEPNRNDDGLYAYVRFDRQAVCIASTNQTTHWAFTSWPAIDCYIERIHSLSETDITDAAALDVDYYRAILDKRGISQETAWEDDD